MDSFKHCDIVHCKIQISAVPLLNVLVYQIRADLGKQGHLCSKYKYTTSDPDI